MSYFVLQTCTGAEQSEVVKT